VARHTAKSHKIRKVEILVIQMEIYSCVIAKYIDLFFFINHSAADSNVHRSLEYECCNIQRF